jgi:hypothetical protein
MKTKMRIKTLNPDLTTLKDRLVDQDTEFQLGVSEKHTGPVTIEVTLRDKADISQFTKYLGQLLGDLPVTTRKVYGLGKAKSPEIDIEPVKELWEEVKKNCKTQDEVIKYLRERNFVFVTSQFIQSKSMPIDLNIAQVDKYQFMIRLLKEAKDPKGDKYDPQLVVGINFIGKEKGKTIKPYLYGKELDSIKLPWSEKPGINFKKIAFIKFPHYMTQDERDKYSLESRKMRLNPELKPTKFYLRWKPAVDELNS